MTLSPRAILGAAPALLVIAGSFYLSRACLRDADRAAVGNGYPRVETVLVASAEDEDRLHRLALKQEAVEDLLEGRISLEDAARRFESLSDLTFEAAVNQVLVFARVRASQEPVRFSDSMARIESDSTSLLAEAHIGQ